MSIVGLTAAGLMGVAELLGASGALGTAARLAEEEEFDPVQVSPGVEGFLFTGLMAAMIIGLGFLLSRRLRRNSYRAEARERIAEELAELEGRSPEDGTRSGDAGSGGAAERPDAAKEPGVPGVPGVADTGTEPGPGSEAGRDPGPRG